MDTKQTFEKVNELLEDTDYPVRITSMADIEDFLLDDNNRRFEEYAVIGRMYDDMRGKPEIDRYSDVSFDEEEEQHQGEKETSISSWNY